MADATPPEPTFPAPASERAPNPTLDPRGASLARTIAARFADLPGVVAVALGGSRGSGGAGPGSDLDLYVYADRDLPLVDRARIAGPDALQPELDHRFWEPGDVWTDPATGLTVDVMYRSPAWIEAELDRVLVRHEASLSYSTALWHNVRTTIPLADPSGWYARLQATARQPYPEPLRRAIVAKNHPLLRASRFSFLHQIEAAWERRDAVSVQHRLTALLASFFDLLFALNRQTHSGEKRLVRYVLAHCPLRPPDLAHRLDALLAAAPPPWDERDFISFAHHLIDDLDQLLAAEGLREPRPSVDPNDGKGRTAVRPAAPPEPPGFHGRPSTPRQRPCPRGVLRITTAPWKLPPIGSRTRADRPRPVAVDH